jgi:hypothetical protein
MTMNKNNSGKENEIVKELTILERVLLPKYLPQESNYAELVIKRNVIDKIMLAEEELKNNNIVFGDMGKLSLPAAATGITKKIKFTQDQFDLIRKSYNKLESDHKLTSEVMSIYEKFCK